MAAIAIVGAGMAGLTAARRLSSRGHSVTVVDKGRSVGGRLATRRIGGATLDHGAQFFTVRTPEFAAAMAQAEEAGAVREWSRGFGPRPDGHPRYAGTTGMNGLAKHLAVGLDVTVGSAISSISVRAGRWSLLHDDGAIEADALVLTPPVPQSLRLLDVGGTALDPATRARLDRIAYHPTLAVLAVLDRPSAMSPPGALQLEDGPFSFVADNQRKGISPVPAVTLHAGHRISADRWTDEPSEVRDDLLGLAEPWIGSAGIVDAQLKRWRFAKPVAPADHEIESTLVEALPLVFAGDAFAGAAVEGAFRSGRAAAEHLTSILPTPT
jgi:renalase